jgi:hypothetical protein
MPLALGAATTMLITVAETPLPRCATFPLRVAAPLLHPRRWWRLGGYQILTPLLDFEYDV